MGCFRIFFPEETRVKNEGNSRINGLLGPHSLSKQEQIKELWISNLQHLLPLFEHALKTLIESTYADSFHFLSK